MAYEARVGVRGELASPKSFSRLIHNNKDDRYKRETHPRAVARFGTKRKRKKKKKSKAIVTNLQTKSILPAEEGTGYCPAK